MNENTKSLLDYIDQAIEEDNGLTEAKATQLADMLDEPEKLADALPELRKIFDKCTEQASKCDRNQKTWQESKKIWKERSDKIMLLLTMVMKKLNLKTFDRDGCKLALRKSEKLIVDDSNLIALYEAHADALRQVVPSFIKVTLTVDKTELKNYLTTDNSLMISNPELIHTQENLSLTLKTKAAS